MRWFVAYRDEAYHDDLTVEEFETREGMLMRANRLNRLGVVIVGVWSEVTNV